MAAPGDEVMRPVGVAQCLAGLTLVEVDTGEPEVGAGLRLAR